MLNIKMIFLFSATLVILTTTTCAQIDEHLQTSYRVLNLAGLHFNLPPLDEINAAQLHAIDDYPFEGLFKRQTTEEEMIPATSELEEDIDGDAGVQQQQTQQEQLGVIAPAAEVATVAEGEPSPTRIVKTFSNSGLRR